VVFFYLLETRWISFLKEAVHFDLLREDLGGGEGVASPMQAVLESHSSEEKPESEEKARAAVELEVSETSVGKDETANSCSSSSSSSS
jgi:hypothetical protein